MQIHRIGVISNPASTRMKREMRRFRAQMDLYPEIAHREIADITEIAGILREFAGLGIDLIGINGGDGTVQAVITAALNERPYPTLPLFTIFPGGQTNMTAEALGVKGKPQHLVTKMLEKLNASQGHVDPVVLPFLEMHLTPQAKPVYGAFFGTASIVRGIFVTRRALHPLRLPNALTHGLAIAYLTLLSLWPFKGPQSPLRREMVGIRAGGHNFDTRAYLVVLATTLDKLLLGLGTSSGTGEGHIRYTSIEYGGMALFRAVRTLFFGRPNNKIVKGLVRRQMHSVEILCRCPVTLDGEMFTPDSDQPIRLGASPLLNFVTF